MYNALMSSHTAMDQIQLAIRQVPNHVKTAMKLITSASNAMLKSMLPLTLGSISRLATESATVAQSTLHRFNLLQDLLGEIIELSAGTQSVNEADIERMNEQKNITTLEQKRINATLNAIEREYNQSKINLQDARREYAKTMQDLRASSNPQGDSQESMLIERLIKTAITAVFNPVEAFGCLLGNCDGPSKPVDNSRFENALKLAEMAKADLEKAEKEYNDRFQRHLTEQNVLAKTMGEMALLDLKVLDTKEIISLLLEATAQINLIREQWTRMILFFSKLAAQAQSTQQVKIISARQCHFD